MTELKSTQRITELDGLRGLAILQILFLHYLVNVVKFEPGSFGAYVMVCFRLTWSGVDLFFVLSGFLIAGILFKQAAATNYYWAFYVRRIHRIFPLYYLNIFCFFALLLIFNTSLSDWLFKNPAPFWSYLSFTQNFYSRAFWSIWLAPTWSLAVEEQFYLILPLLIRVCSERKMFWIALFSVIIAPILRIALLLWNASVNLFDNRLIEMLAITRADSLMLGVLVAWLFRRDGFREFVVINRSKFYWTFTFLALGMVVITLNYSFNDVVFRAFTFTWVALFYAVLLTLVISHHHSFLGMLLRTPLLLALGTISYCVYLIHMPIVGLCHSLFFGTEPAISNVRELLVTFLALVLTITIARISWRWLESPLIRRGHSFSYHE